MVNRGGGGGAVVVEMEGEEVRAEGDREVEDGRGEQGW